MFKELIIQQAEELLADGTTTTLDIKNACIQNHPVFFWTQDRVSTIMQEAHENELIPDLEYDDNGTYRTYYLESDDKADVETIGRTDLAQLLIDEMGQDVKVQFVKTDGTTRDMECVINSQNALGYFEVDEFNVGPRSVNPRTLISATVNGINYQVS